MLPRKDYSHYSDNIKEDFQPTMGDPNVLMDAYMISVTLFNTVKQIHRRYPLNIETYEEQIHLLFNEKSNYINRLFELTFKTPW